MAQVAGKVALVTGGGSGIGRACAQVLAREGAKVMVTDIDDQGGSETAKSITDKGGAAKYLRQDVTSEAEWEKIVAATVVAFGKLDILVNNAGIGISGPIADFTLEDWRRQTAINLDGVFLGTKYAIRQMRGSGGGSIVIMSSVAGFNGAPNMSGYCATKGGVRLFAKAAAMECAQLDYKIRVNSVHPGIIDTPIWTKIPRGAGQSANPAIPPGANRVDPNALAAMFTPMKRAGQAEEIAEGVLFLASDASSYVTGTELIIDGGICAR